MPAILLLPVLSVCLYQLRGICRIVSRYQVHVPGLLALVSAALTVVECFVAVRALIALGPDVQCNLLAVHGQVFDELCTVSVFTQVIRSASRTGCQFIAYLYAEMIMALAFFHVHNLV